MKVVFKTSAIDYQTNCFPENIDTPPRINEKVCVVDAFTEYYANKGLPLFLTVTDVWWTEKGVIVRLFP